MSIKYSLGSLICRIVGHKSFYDHHKTVNKEYDFCQRCLLGIGKKSNRGKGR